MKIDFRPVSSHLVGRSFGVNDVPATSFGYCPLGPTSASRATLRTLFPTEPIAAAVRGRVEALRARRSPAKGQESDRAAS